MVRGVGNRGHAPHYGSEGGTPSNITQDLTNVQNAVNGHNASEAATALQKLISDCHTWGGLDSSASQELGNLSNSLPMLQKGTIPASLHVQLGLFAKYLGSTTPPTLPPIPGISSSIIDEINTIIKEISMGDNAHALPQLKAFLDSSGSFPRDAKQVVQTALNDLTRDYHTNNLCTSEALDHLCELHDGLFLAQNHEAPLHTPSASAPLPYGANSFFNQDIGLLNQVLDDLANGNSSDLQSKLYELVHQRNIGTIVDIFGRIQSSFTDLLKDAPTSESGGNWAPPSDLYAHLEELSNGFAAAQKALE